MNEAVLNIEARKQVKTVLLVEDHWETRDILRTFLISENYHVLEAETCTEALNCLDQNIDIALLDYRLPDGNGIELIKEIREIKPGLPVIIMSGYGTEDLAVRSYRAGATDYIKKPPEFNYLKGKMAELLGEEVVKDNSGPECLCSSEELALDRIVKYIKTHHTEDITLDKLAEMAGMSRFNFSRLFNKKFGTGYLSYLNNIRIEHAKELLRNPALSISDIADFIGFRSLSQFERVFKDVEGVAPRDYRKRISLQSPD